MFDLVCLKVFWPRIFLFFLPLLKNIHQWCSFLIFLCFLTAVCSNPRICRRVNLVFFVFQSIHQNGKPCQLRKQRGETHGVSPPAPKPFELFVTEMFSLGGPSLKFSSIWKRDPWKRTSVRTAGERTLQKNKSATSPKVWTTSVTLFSSSSLFFHFSSSVSSPEWWTPAPSLSWRAWRTLCSNSTWVQLSRTYWTPNVSSDHANTSYKWFKNNHIDLNWWVRPHWWLQESRANQTTAVNSPKCFNASLLIVF